MAKGKKADAGGEPYPTHVRPTPAECQDALAQLHGTPDNPVKELAEQKDVQAVVKQSSSRDSVLDSLVRTILSQNTTDTTSHRAFSKLKDTCPTWEDMRQAPAEQVEEAIKEGGLAKTKTARMQAILNMLHEEKGECSLEYLRSMTDQEVKDELKRFKGVGAKTIACVLMFCLGCHEFPVDTHVWRIAKNLGWVPASATRDETYEHLNRRVPGEIKYDLHVLLVEHGKRCDRCAKNGKPRKEVHGPCPLTKQTAAARKQAAADDGHEEHDIKPEDNSEAGATMTEQDIKKEDSEGAAVKEEEEGEAAPEGGKRAKSEQSHDVHHGGEGQVKKEPAVKQEQVKADPDADTVAKDSKPRRGKRQRTRA